MMKNRSRGAKIFQAVLFILSLGLLIYFCVSDNNLMVLLQSLPGLNLFWLFCAAGCVPLTWMMDSLVIQTLVSHAFEERYGFRRAYKVTMVGQYFNSVTPYALAGQPMQLVALIRQGIPSGVALSALVRKFLVYQVTLTVYSLIVIVLRFQFFQSQIQGFMALAVVGFIFESAVVVLLAMFAYSPAFTTKVIHAAVWLLKKLHIVRKPEETGESIRGQLEFYLETNRAMRGNRRLVARVYGFTVLQQTALFAVPFFIYKAFHSPGAPVFDMIAAQSFVTMISNFTPLPGAAGAAEGSFLVIFQIFFSSGVIKQAMLLWRLLAYYSCVVVGAFFAGLDSRGEKLHFRQHHGQKPEPQQTAEDRGATDE